MSTWNRNHGSAYADRCKTRAERAEVNPERCSSFEEEEDDCIADHYVLLTGLYLFWVMSWIGASVPLYIMCCCTPRPVDVRPPDVRPTRAHQALSLEIHTGLVSSDTWSAHTGHTPDIR